LKLVELNQILQKEVIVKMPNTTPGSNNPNWIGHDIKRIVESEFKNGKDQVVLENKDGNTYLLFVNVLRDLKYQFTTQSIPYGTRFTIERSVQNA